MAESRAATWWRLCFVACLAFSDRTVWFKAALAFVGQSPLPGSGIRAWTSAFLRVHPWLKFPAVSIVCFLFASIGSLPRHSEAEARLFAV
jgi:hypothetical protein